MPKGKRMTLVEKAYGSVKTAVSDCIIQSQASITYDRRNDQMHIEAKRFLFTLPSEGLRDATITLAGSGKTYYPAAGYFRAVRRARKALTYDEQAAWYALSGYSRFEKEGQEETSHGKRK